MDTKILYSAKAKAVGGRDGHVETLDGTLNLKLSLPKSLGGPGIAGATNPEQLFAAGYAACFESAIRHIARSEKINIINLSVEAEVNLIPATQGFALQVHLYPKFSDLDLAIGQMLVNKAHQICPYSNATRNNIEVQISVLTQA